MNGFMELQVKNALTSVQTLDKSIELSALEDDGKVSRQERKQIKKIRKAIKRFENAIGSVM
jgi:hypothetical protein